MINLHEIKNYVGRAVDEKETNELKEYFRKLKEIRNPIFIDSNDFERILRWKLRGQYNRNIRHIRKNNNEVIKEITKHAFSVSCTNNEKEIEEKIKILRKLDGVGVGVASAILALIFPEKYCVIDFRGWEYIFGEEKRTFTVSEYIKYLKEIKNIADKIGLTPQETDLAVWACHKNNKKQHPS